MEAISSVKSLRWS